MVSEPSWVDADRWEALCDGRACPICLDGGPRDVIAELPTTWVTAGHDALLPGYTCVVSKRHVVEPYELPDDERAAFWDEVLTVARTLCDVLDPVKLNYEIHGNTVPHLHLHLYPRFRETAHAAGTDEVLAEVARALSRRGMSERSPRTVLRNTTEADVPVFYEHQRDPAATRLAVFPSRDEEAFAAHWRRVLDDETATNKTATNKTIVFDGKVAGYVVCFERDGRKEVGYWLGREFWGRGLATRALSELLDEVTDRPLHAIVAATNAPSIRVLEKCGFVVVDSRSEFDEALGEHVEELVLELTR
jgi:RimJ/RimL family protein N-acetyltransferase